MFPILKFKIFESVGLPRIFDWEGPKPQITRNDVIRIFRKKGLFTVEWKIRIWGLVWRVTRICWKGKLKPKVKNLSENV